MDKILAFFDYKKNNIIIAICTIVILVISLGISLNDSINKIICNNTNSELIADYGTLIATIFCFITMILCIVKNRFEPNSIFWICSFFILLIPLIIDFYSTYNKNDCGELKYTSNTFKIIVIVILIIQIILISTNKISTL